MVDFHYNGPRLYMPFVDVIQSIFVK